MEVVRSEFWASSDGNHNAGFKCQLSNLGRFVLGRCKNGWLDGPGPDISEDVVDGPGMYISIERNTHRIQVCHIW